MTRFRFIRTKGIRLFLSHHKTIGEKGVVASVMVIMAMCAIALTGFVQSHFELSKNLDIFTAVYREVNLNYVEETSPGSLMKTSIDAMLASLDPYTNFIPEADIEDYRFMTTHEYGGIGALIGQRGEYIMITEPYEGSPADKAGLRAGDILLSVDGKSAVGKNSEELSNLLRGQSGTTILVKLKREATGEELVRSITRDKIKLEDVPYFGMLNANVGYIVLSGFTETASQDVRSAFENLKKQGMSQLILDLRGNGGGLLREAVSIVNMFVAKGETVVEVKGKLREHYSLNRALNSPMDLEIPLVVLIDEASASASEIVSGTLQDLDRAVVIGYKSFGKGLVQATHDLSYNAKLKITIAKYYTPSGRCIQRIDYGHRDTQGKALERTESSLATFKTRSGRVVTDGNGINPDITMADTNYSELLEVLSAEFILFDYATRYYFKNPSIAEPDKFQLSDTDYADFVNYASQRDFEYTTSSSRMILEFEESLKQDAFWDEVKMDLVPLKQKLQRDKAKDMMKFREEIQLALENEIVGRYYYSRGRIRAYLAHDPDVKKAMEVLGNKGYYRSVLDGTCADCNIRKG